MKLRSEGFPPWMWPTLIIRMPIWVWSPHNNKQSHLVLQQAKICKFPGKFPCEKLIPRCWFWFVTKAPSTNSTSTATVNKLCYSWMHPTILQVRCPWQPSSEKASPANSEGTMGKDLDFEGGKLPLLYCGYSSTIVWKCCCLNREWWGGRGI